MEKAIKLPADFSSYRAIPQHILDVSPGSFLFASLSRSCTLQLPCFLTAVKMQMEA